MTISGETICSVIQSFPVLLILAQSRQSCLNTPFIYKPPKPTRTPEFYEAYDYILQHFGHNNHDYHGHDNHGHDYHEHDNHGHDNHGHDYHGHDSHGHNCHSHNHGYGYGHGYGYQHDYYKKMPDYHEPCHHDYHSQGQGHHGYIYPSFKKANVYNVSGAPKMYAPTNQVYKVIVKKTKIKTKKRSKLQMLREAPANKSYDQNENRRFQNGENYQNQKIRRLAAIFNLDPSRSSQERRSDYFAQTNPYYVNGYDSYARPVINNYPYGPEYYQNYYQNYPNRNNYYQEPAVNFNNNQSPNYQPNREESFNIPNVQPYENSYTTQGYRETQNVDTVMKFPDAGNGSPNAEVPVSFESRNNEAVMTVAPNIQELTPVPNDFTSLPELTPVPQDASGIRPQFTAARPVAFGHLPELNPAPQDASENGSQFTSVRPVAFGHLPELTPVPNLEHLPELTPVPKEVTTSLPELTPVPKLADEVNFAHFHDTCTTVDGGSGTCTAINNCAEYVQLLKTAKVNPIAVQILRKAHCGFQGNNPKVCCPSQGFPTAPTAFTTTTTPNPYPDARPFVGLPSAPECGSTNASTSKVVGGVPAKLGDFPWMALLGYQPRRNGGTRWLCGGSLISSKHVLTAAHCIHGHEKDLYLVRLGELDLTRDDEGATPIDVPIRQHIPHPDYSSTAFTNDIGILLLERQVEFTALIRAICIPLDPELRSKSYENYQPIIAGWGNTEFRGESAPHLQALQLPVVSNEYCATAYKPYPAQTIDSRVLCAGYKKGGRDACQGDSGGPLMQPVWNKNTYKTYYFQIGVVSFGRKCAEPGFPGVYTRVTHFAPWIQQVVQDTGNL